MDQVFSILLLVFGFGFVIFWHELGHFLAAKWVGIKVEQFAVGFGQAILSWRKGMGVTVGSSGKKYDELLRARAADGIGETEYRLNWIPLGGYVKMLGQDDLHPNAQQEDPRAYNKKSIGARMLVVSAGVIMNIILAAFGFMVLFLIGFSAPPAVVGSVAPSSPAAKAVRPAADGKLEHAPIQVGDRILYFDDKYQHDFTKITLNVALVEEGVPVPMLVRRVDGREEHLSVVPERVGNDGHGFLMLGVGQPFELRGLDQRTYDVLRADAGPDELVPQNTFDLKPGDTVTAVNGVPVVAGGKDDEYWKLDRALQASGGKPIDITVTDAAGEARAVSVRPVFTDPFGANPLNILGMVPRPELYSIRPDSSVKGQVKPGDVVVALSFPNGDAVAHPTIEQFIEAVNKAGQSGQTLDLTVERQGQEVTLEDLSPTTELPGGRRGFGIIPRYTGAGTPVVADVIDDTPTAAAGIPAGARITAVGGQPVESWGDVRGRLAEATPGEPVKITVATESGGSRDYELTLKEDKIREVAGMRYTHALLLHDRQEPRQTDNPLVAAGWGVTETRDFVLQFYLTLKRMVQGSVSYKNMMGPVGIFDAGRKFAYKGTDWLIWFLAMISANLAVVNFLPIPIVDGGLFAFLIIEKIQGRPLSAKTQSIAQVVGLAVILSVFLLVTYQDIARFFLQG
jgi:regulator of sigma E protease